MTPYWRSDDGAIVVYHGRYEDALAAGCVPVREVALVHDDPPYGIDMAPGDAKPRSKNAICATRAFPKVRGDKEPFDPSPIILLRRPTVLWGANNYAARLPDSAAWLVWDKRVAMPSDDGSDCELAWSNIGASARTFRHVWKGMVRDSERHDAHLHPTQKPIALCSWVYARAKLKRGDLVFVPHMGSGPDLPACRAAGLRCIAVEVERAAEPAGPLFAPR